MTRRLTPLLLVLLFALAAMPPAQADDKWQTSNALWKVADKCARDAAAKYPDYTKESLAKREAMRRNCLRANNLPVTDGPGPTTR